MPVYFTAARLFLVLALFVPALDSLVVTRPCCGTYDHVPAAFGPRGVDVSGRVWGGMRSTGCDIPAAANLTGAIALVIRGDCKFAGALRERKRRNKRTDSAKAGPKVNPGMGPCLDSQCARALSACCFHLRCRGVPV